MFPSNRTLSRFARMATQGASTAAAIRAFHPFSMLSDEELFFLHMFCTTLAEPVRVAELGCYVGGTTSLFGEATPPNSIIEVYDLFLHNAASRERLNDDPLYDGESFFSIWERNTNRYRSKIKLNRGDLNETMKSNLDPLDIVYVDVVKHETLINPMIPFYDRLAVGGVLLHQDYFHWQSPWLVYQMEFFNEYFDLVGDCGHNMTIYRKVKDIESHTKTEWANLSSVDILSLFDRAIARYSASKAGMLKVSKLRLAMDIEPSLTKKISDEIMESHSESPRVMRYMRALQASKNDLQMMW